MGRPRHAGAAASIGAAVRTHLYDRFDADPLRHPYRACGADRQPADGHITLLDVRVEKRVEMKNRRVAGFVDVFNGLNANPEQNTIWSSGESFLRPVSIVSPRIARVGLTFDW